MKNINSIICVTFLSLFFLHSEAFSANVSLHQLIDEKDFVQFMAAVKMEDTEILNEEGFIGRTPIMHLIKTYNFAEKTPIAVSALLDRNVELNKHDLDGWTAILLATEDNRIEIVKQLIAKKVNGDKALILAANKGYFEIANMIIKSGANINEHDNQGNTALTEAARRGHKEIISILLAANANCFGPQIRLPVVNS
jgi:ankyrin repeat protein